MTQGPATNQPARRNLLATLGITPLQIGFWVVGMIVSFGLALAWDLFIADVINDQVKNKYFLTIALLVLCIVWAALSLIINRRRPADDPARPRSLVGSIMVALGTALLLLGSAITPIGIYHASNPTRSVPVGYAYFTIVFLGLFIGGFGGNMLAPRRA